MRWMGVFLFSVWVMLAWGVQAARVTLDDGTVREGQVIVRGDIVTIVSPAERGTGRLFQYPIDRVIRITGDSNSPNIVNRRTALRAGAARRFEPLAELEKGLEVKRLALQRGWVQVEAWDDDIRGFILESELASEVQFTAEERETARRRLAITDPPPPPRSGTGVASDSEPPVPLEESLNEETLTQTEEEIMPDAEMDESFRE